MNENREKNLVQNKGLSRKEADALSRKGGQRSGETRRRKRNMKETMIALLESPAPEKNKDIIDKFGLDEDATNMAVLVASSYEKALKGNSQALKFFQSCVGAFGLTENDKERLRLDRERLKLDRQRLEFEMWKEQEKDAAEMSKLDALIESIDKVAGNGTKSETD
ncbi:MAG: hypothetical protein J6D36_01730 [Erysipelotrichaceae bacterium]|nr:hypothetical protein [Erysipelotrichaceae bacterium]